MNVLMIGPDRSVHGGISAVVNGYYEAGLDKKVNLSYIGTMKEGSKVYKLIIAAKAYLKFVSLIKKADVVHVNVASDNSFWRKAVFIKKAKKSGKPIIIHQHGGEWNNFFASLDGQNKEKVRNVLKSADKFLVLSPYYKDFFENIIGVKDVIVFPDTIDIPEKINKLHNGKRILFLGRLCKEKGIAELVEAVTELHDIYDDVELSLGGIWEDRSLEKSIDSCEFIKYLGWMDSSEKFEELSKADIFVMPSYFEGQSLAILEAMSMNCSIVASNVGGIPMMIEDGITGILVEPKSAASLYEGIKKVIDDTSLADSIAENAYNKALNEFNILHTVDEIVKMYEELKDAVS